MTDKPKKITVVANESGEIIAAVVHSDPSDAGLHGASVKPRPGQSAITVDAPEELAHRVPDAEYLKTLRHGYAIRDGALEKG